MPMLGEVLAAARRSSSGFERWIEAREPGMALALAEAARSEGESVAGYARLAVADFARAASEEDWAHLTSRLRESEEPGMACLATMVQWRIALAARHAHHSHGAEP